MSTFLEKLDELIAGKTPGEWLVKAYNYVEDGLEMRNRRIEGVISHQSNYPLSTPEGRRHDADINFIAFVGTHAELIRDALKIARHLRRYCLGTDASTENMISDFDAAFKALDEAVK